MKTPQVSSIVKLGSGHFRHFGLMHELQTFLSRSSIPSSLNIQLHVDGLQIWNDSAHEFWPILGQINNGRVFVVSLFYGKGKPDLNFLLPVIEELQNLLQSGLQFGQATIKVLDNTS